VPFSPLFLVCSSRKLFEDILWLAVGANKLPIIPFFPGGAYKDKLTGRMRRERQREREKERKRESEREARVTSAAQDRVVRHPSLADCTSQGEGGHVGGFVHLVFPV
jgi:hypothetical protein